MRLKFYRIIANAICIACLIGFTAYLIAAWKTLPDQIPAHYNAAGEVDRMGDKASVLIMPIMNWILYSMISVLEHFPQVWNTGVTVTEANRERVYAILFSMITSVKVLVVVVFTYIGICEIKGFAIAMWFTPIFLLIMFGIIIVHIVLLFRAGR